MRCRRSTSRDASVRIAFCRIASRILSVDTSAFETSRNALQHGATVRQLRLLRAGARGIDATLTAPRLEDRQLREWADRKQVLRRVVAVEQVTEFRAHDPEERRDADAQIREPRPQRDANLRRRGMQFVFGLAHVRPRASSCAGRPAGSVSGMSNVPRRPDARNLVGRVTNQKAQRVLGLLAALLGGSNLHESLPVARGPAVPRYPMRPAPAQRSHERSDSSWLLTVSVMICTSSSSSRSSNQVVATLATSEFMTTACCILGREQLRAGGLVAAAEPAEQIDLPAQADSRASNDACSSPACWVRWRSRR